MLRCFGSHRLGSGPWDAICIDLQHKRVYTYGQVQPLRVSRATAWVDAWTGQPHGLKWAVTTVSDSHSHIHSDDDFVMALSLWITNHAHAASNPRQRSIFQDVSARVVRHVMLQKKESPPASPSPEPEVVGNPPLSPLRFTVRRGIREDGLSLSLRLPPAPSLGPNTEGLWHNARTVSKISIWTTWRIGSCGGSLPHAPRQAGGT